MRSAPLPDIRDDAGMIGIPGSSMFFVWIALLAIALVSGVAPSRAQVMIRQAAAPWDLECRPSGRQSRTCVLSASAQIGERGRITVWLLPPPQAESVLSVQVPSGISSRAVLHLAIDDDAERLMAFRNCSSTCDANYQLTPELFDRLKRGRTLRLRVMRDSASIAAAEFSLSGLETAIGKLEERRQQRGPGGRILYDGLDQKYQPPFGRAF